MAGNAGIVDENNPLGLNTIIYRLAVEASNVLSSSDLRKLVLGALGFSGKFPPEMAENLFVEEQVSENMTFANEERPNWTWVTKCCPTDTLCFREGDDPAIHTFDTQLTTCFWKSKAILYGRLMSKYRSQEQHYRVGQIIGYLLYVLYENQGILYRLPECLNDANRWVVDWMGFYWGTGDIALPFDNRELQGLGITKQQFLLADNDNEQIFQASPEGFWDRNDKEFVIAMQIHRSARKAELCKEFLETFDETLTEFSNRVTFDAPVHSVQIEEIPPDVE